MRILIVSGDDLNRLHNYGIDNVDYPRSCLAYPFYGYLKEKKINVELLSLNNEPSHGATKGNIKISNLLKLLYYARHISSYDLVIAWGYPGAIISLLLSIFRANHKVLIFVYANFFRESKSLIIKLKELIFHFALKIAGGCIYMTFEQAEEAVNILKIAQEKIYYLPLGVDTKFYAPKYIKEYTSLDKDIVSFIKENYVVVSGDQLRDENKIAEILSDSGLNLFRLTQSKRTQNFWDKWSIRNEKKMRVFCRSNLSPKDVRFVYQNSMCVLNIVDNSWQPAGWSVALEGLASGVSVVINSGLVTRELNKYKDTPIVQTSSPISINEVKNMLIDLSKKQKTTPNDRSKERDFVEKYLMIEKTGESLAQIISQRKERTF